MSPSVRRWHRCAATPAWVGATSDIAGLLAGLGHRVTPVRFRYPVIAPIARWSAGTAIDGAGLEAGLLQRRTRTHITVGRAALRLGLVRERQVERLNAKMRTVFGDVDAVITPTLARPPAQITSRSRRSWLVNTVADIHFSPFTAQWNVLGWPAASVPAGWHEPSGSPLAVQIAAPPGNEQLILSIAAQIERHQPWPRQSPG